MKYASTPKERMFRALLGEKPDVLPAAPCYLSLFLADSVRAGYIEQYRQRMQGRSHLQIDHTEDTHLRARALIQAYSSFTSPPDWIEVDSGASKAWAEHTAIVSQGDVLFYKDKVSGAQVPMHSIPLPVGDALFYEGDARFRDFWNSPVKITSRDEVDALISITSADELLVRGDLDLPRLVAAECGNRYFISTILDTPYSDAYSLLGFKGLMIIQRQNPNLFQYLLEGILEQSRGIVAAWADTGIHGVFAEEVFTGADAISPGNYDKFVFTYNQPFFQHMRGLNLLPIHYVCGDAIPRLKRMVEYDIAAVAVEESKKKFRIDISKVVEQVAGRTAVLGNIDTVQFGLHSSPDEMVAEIERQSRIGLQAKGFVVGTGSPFPLETNLLMIDTLIGAAHALVAA